VESPREGGSIGFLRFNMYHMYCLMYICMCVVILLCNNWNGWTQTRPCSSRCSLNQSGIYVSTPFELYSA